MDTYFFEIPIYRCNEKEHSIHMNEMRSRFYYEGMTEEGKNMLDYWFEKRDWYSWKFNEIIGFLRLYSLGNQLRGEIWKIENKRINKGIIKKKFKWIGKAFEISVEPDWSNQNYIDAILEAIKELNSARDFKNRYLDIAIFLSIAKFVNWKELSNMLNPSHPKI